MISKGLRLEEMPREEAIGHLTETVQPEKGLIPAFIYNDPTVYKLELEKIFLKTWVFLGHESEIAGRNDFITRDLGGQSVVLTKADDGKIRGFLNMCTHRGMKLCLADKGTKGQFTCPYHGFVFKNTGELIGVPLREDIYGGMLDTKALAMHQVRVETYKGLIFGTWNHNAESLDEFLGDFKWYLDMVVGRAEMEVVGPPQKFIVNANWKIGSDNFNGDSYHTMTTHGSIVKLGMVKNATYSKLGYQIGTKNGHGINIGTGNPVFGFDETLISEFKQNLSKEQFDLLADMKNMVGTIFPNLSFLISHTELKGKPISNTTIRLWRPVAENKMEIITWFLVEKNASEDWKKRSKEVFILTFSASGIFEQDDTEVFVDMTNAMSGMLPYEHNITLNYVMGMHRQPLTDFPGPGTVYDDKFTEANQRAFYRKWLDMLSERGNTQ